MCACFATCCLAQNRAEIFLDFEHLRRQGRLSPNKSSATAEDDQAKRAFFACSPLQKRVWAVDEKILKPHQKYTRARKHKKNGVLFGSPTSSR